MKKFTNLSFLFLLVGSIVYAHATKSAETLTIDNLNHERRLTLKTNKFGEKLTVNFQISSTGDVKINTP